MSDRPFDLEAWLTRIGYGGSRTPSLETLKALIGAHQAIPFENVDVFLGQVPRLDLESLQTKLVGRWRGGYCYEQNLLFRAGLVALGFSVISLMARVLLGLDADAARPATHMVLRVDLQEGAFIADVGFGRLTPTAPLAVRPDVEQRTPHDVMRLLRAGEELVLQARPHDEWQNLYRLSLEPKLDIDYEVANWFTATHPDSPFVRNLMVARAGTGGLRHTFLNGLATIRRRGEITQRRVLDKTSYATVLEQTFNLTLPERDLAAAIAEMDHRCIDPESHSFLS